MKKLALLVTGLALFFSRTRIGRALRAVADDHQAALAVGIPLQQIWAIVWAVAGFVALVTGMLWGGRLGTNLIELHYLELDPNSPWAAEARRLASKMTPAERAEHFRQAMVKIYGGRPKETTGAGR